MKPFKVEIKRGHESFRGFDHYNVLTYEVEAMHANSAINKAKKIHNKPFKIGWIQAIHVYQDDKLVESWGNWYV